MSITEQEAIESYRRFEEEYTRWACLDYARKMQDQGFPYRAAEFGLKSAIPAVAWEFQLLKKELRELEYDQDAWCKREHEKLTHRLNELARVEAALA